MSETSGFNGEARARIRRAVRRVEAGDAGRAGASGGATQPPTTVRVTDGTPDGGGLYEAVVTRWDRASGDWEDHGSCRLKPANGQTLAEGTRYDANPAGLTAEGHLLYVTTDGGGAGSLTVEKLDWVGGHTVSDTRTGIGTIQLSEYSGLTYEQMIHGTPPAGTVRLEGKSADGHVWGLVTDLNQHWIGKKFICDGMEFGWDADYSTYRPASAPFGSPFWTDMGTIHRNAPLCIVCGVYSRDDEVGTDHDLRGRIELFPGSSIAQEPGVSSYSYKTTHKDDCFAIAARENGTVEYPAAALCFFRPGTDGLGARGPTGGVEFLDGVVCVYGPIEPQIRMYVDGVEHGGKTGTLSDGTEVTGGVITDIDDGSGFFTGTVP